MRTASSTVVAEADATANAVRNEADEAPPTPGTGDIATTPRAADSWRNHPGAIPGPLGHGAGDCTSTRGDAKGLMTDRRHQHPLL